MRALILAGGFATRLGPLGEQIPKAMIVVNGETVLDNLLGKLAAEKVEATILTNRRFENFFTDYENVLIEDARREEEKLGAVSAINNAIEKLGIDEDVFVIASDNYFSSDFREFLSNYSGEPLIGVYYAGDSPEIKLEEMGTIMFDGCGSYPPPKKVFTITKFLEKSKQPVSKYVATGAYILPRSIFPILKEYCKGRKRDHLGSFIEHLLENKVRVKGFLFEGKWFDVSHVSYLRVFSSGRLVRTDERYIVSDLTLGELVLRLVILHPGKSTTGHSRQGSEVYFFIEGQGQIEVNGEVKPVKSKDMVPINPGEFHRIHNNSDKDLIFINVYERRA
jgi:glucose-1-phosphate thymidylyltransferase